jgi:hypothetical protein
MTCPDLEKPLLKDANTAAGGPDNLFVLAAQPQEASVRVADGNASFRLRAAVRVGRGYAEPLVAIATRTTWASCPGHPAVCPPAARTDASGDKSQLALRPALATLDSVPCATACLQAVPSIPPSWPSRTAFPGNSSPGAIRVFLWHGPLLHTSLFRRPGLRASRAENTLLASNQWHTEHITKTDLGSPRECGRNKSFPLTRKHPLTIAAAALP